MNSVQILCPKCDKNVPQLKLINGYTEVEIKCKCGNEQKIALNDYLKQFNNNQGKTIQYNNICKEDNEILNYYCRTCNSYRCKLCKQHNGDYDQSGNYSYEYAEYIPDFLTCNPQQTVKDFEDLITNYLPSFKKEYLSTIQDKSKQDKFNQIYDKVIKKYTDILSFLQILAKNYREDNYYSAMNLENNTFFNVTKFTGDFESEKDIANYLEQFCLNKYSNTYIEEKSTKRNPYRCLNDGRIIVSNNEDVSILDPYNNYHIDFKIQFEAVTYIFGMAKLDDGNIAIGVRLDNELGKNKIKIYKINKDNAECVLTLEDTKEVPMLALSGNKLALGYANSFVIYDFSKEYSNKNVKKIDHDNLDERKFFYSRIKNIIVRKGFSSTHLVWDMKTYERVPEMEKFFNTVVNDEYNSICAMKEINDHIMICQFNKNIAIINLNTLTFERIKYNHFIHDMILLRDKNTVIFVDHEGYFYELNLEKKILTQRKFFETKMYDTAYFETVNEHTFIIIDNCRLKEYQY